jgi:hypothetical protein
MRREDTYTLIHANAKLEAQRRHGGEMETQETTETTTDAPTRMAHQDLERMEKGDIPSMEWVLANLRHIKYTGRIEVTFSEGVVVGARRVEEER